MSTCAKSLHGAARGMRLGLVARGVLRTGAGLAFPAIPIASMLGHGFIGPFGQQNVTAEKTSPSGKNDRVEAARLSEPLDREGFPSEVAWQKTEKISFDADWQGKNADPQRQTEVRLLWTNDAVYVRFHARYRTITVFADAEPNGRRDELWNRDVAEVFFQPDGWELRRYTEFEVSPNGLWIDLDIAPGGKHDLQSGLKRRVQIDEKDKTWVAELALPMRSLTARFDPSAVWRVNFFHVEGAAEPRFYSAWRATGTPAPNFHVPERFGRLVFKK